MLTFFVARFLNRKQKGQKQANGPKSLFMVAPHSTVVSDIGGKGEYETNENRRNKRKVSDFFVCFVSFV
ncbi:MAG: hypothetical protein J2P41_00655, partial [Blastocatellia bacterium]|nr:hypothetical protein [Blastocatellia bacterium]